MSLCQRLDSFLKKKKFELKKKFGGAVFLAISNIRRYIHTTIQIYVYEQRALLYRFTMPELSLNILMVQTLIIQTMNFVK